MSMFPKNDPAASPTSPTPPAPVAFPASQWLPQALIVLVAVAVYYVGVNNCFTFDDFIWLDRARTFKHNWWQIFRQDVTYFDPLVHLMFLADSAVAGLDYRWYHLVDLGIHAANSLLVYRFARQLSGSRRAALYAGILFAGSFAIADAVLWSSSRVDLVSTMFSLASLIQFLCYLRRGSRSHLALSLALFVLALAAKGTPLVVPGLFLLLLLLEKKPLRQASCLIPFGAVVLVYLVLLKLTVQHAALPLDRLHFNLRNVALSLCTLFVPEQTVKYMNASLLAVVLLAALSVAALLAFPSCTAVTQRRAGFALMLLAIVPVLVVTDFKLLSEYSDPYLMLSSPSHRIYLASTGAALLCGGVLGALQEWLARFGQRSALVAVAVVLIAIIGVDAVQVRQRNQLWQAAADRSQVAVKGLLSYRRQVPAGSQLGLIYFPGSGGFQAPMARVCLDADDLTVIKSVTLGPVRDPELLGKAEKTFLFVLGRDGRLIDKTQPYRQQLLANRMAIMHPDHPEYLSRCVSIAEQINREID